MTGQQVVRMGTESGTSMNKETKEKLRIQGASLLKSWDRKDFKDELNGTDPALCRTVADKANYSSNRARRRLVNEGLSRVSFFETFEI